MQTPKHIERTYLGLMLLQTLAASFIWGINTLFLLSAGLSNFEAFAANAFYTVGEVLFEVPTGIVADVWGRRLSYILGTITLGVSTLLYLYAWQIHAPFWIWAGTSMLLGLGFTFFSGATEAWLVDALHATDYKGTLENVFAKSQVTTGAAMLIGSVGGGLIAQATNLGVPYILRAIVLGANCLVAFIFMKDLGFTPKTSGRVAGDIKNTFKKSLDFGLKNPPMRWLMLGGLFSSGVGIYVFYAMQPYLLKLWGDPHAYWIAGLAAAIFACAQIIGGFLVPSIKRLFPSRTTILIVGTAMSAILLLGIGLFPNFWIAIALLVLWGLLFAAMMPVRQACMNDLIPGEERATVLSFDALFGSSGGVVIQPTLGKIADVWSYPLSYVASGIIQAIALPFLLLTRRAKKE